MQLHNAYDLGDVTVFVASTMPFDFVSGIAKKGDVIKLVLLGHNLIASYSRISSLYPNVHISVVPRNSVLQAIYLAYCLMKSVVSRRPVVFFHECCCPILDVLIKVIRPPGHHFPMVEMSNVGWLCPFDLYPTGKMRYFLQASFLWRWFFVYESPPLGNSSSKHYFLTLKKYPASIKTHSVESSRMLLGVDRDAATLKGTKKIIFLCGLSRFDKSKVISVLTAIAKHAIKNGFECYVKDHPNSGFRLGFNHAGVITINPTIPVESLDDVFSLAIGISSNSLSWYGDRAISIINLIGGLSEQDRIFVENFITKLPGGDRFTYPESINEVFCILNRISLVSLDDSLQVDNR